MNLLRSILHDLALVVLVTSGVLTCLVLWKTLGTVDAVNVALATVNAPCKDNGHQVMCGTLAQVGQTTKNTGILAAQGAESAMQSRVLIAGAVKNLDKIGDSVTGEVSALQDTTKALTTTAQTASTSLQTITDGITPVLASTKSTVDDVGAAVASLQPVETAAAKSAADFDTLILNPNIPRILDNGQTISNAFVTTIGTTNHMLFTFDAVETKAMHGYLYPPHGAAAIWPTVRPFLVPAAQVGGAVAISIH